MSLLVSRSAPYGGSMSSNVGFLYTQPRSVQLNGSMDEDTIRMTGTRLGLFLNGEQDNQMTHKVKFTTATTLTAETIEDFLRARQFVCFAIMAPERSDRYTEGPPSTRFVGGIHPMTMSRPLREVDSNASIGSLYAIQAISEPEVDDNKQVRTISRYFVHTSLSLYDGIELDSLCTGRMQFSAQRVGFFLPTINNEVIGFLSAVEHPVFCNKNNEALPVAQVAPAV